MVQKIDSMQAAMPHTADLQASFRRACHAGRISTARKMLASHGWGNLVPDENNPLRSAADGGHLELCALLIKAGAPVNGFDQGHTPLMSAAMMNRTQICVLLLSHGADLALCRPCDQKTALEIADAHSHPEAVFVLSAWRAKQAALLVLGEISDVKVHNGIKVAR